MDVISKFISHIWKSLWVVDVLFVPMLVFYSEEFQSVSFYLLDPSQVNSLPHFIHSPAAY
jgi:hypothetical protein